jgi:BASS family bile acid:Na+ symporter
LDSGAATILLPVALGIVMLGLGLALTVADFRRVAQEPRAVLVALACQLLLLPPACLGLVLAFDLSAELAVGMLLLAASPGGTTANLFSHLFRGDVALNITLTAVNSVLAIVSLPLVVGLAIGHFDPVGTDGDIGLQFGKVLQVFAIVLVPVTIGMLVRARRPAFAIAADRPVRRFSVAVLVIAIIGTAIAEHDRVLDELPAVGPVALLFCAISLAVGYGVPRLAGVGDRQAVACAMEIGMHNATIAIAVATSVLGSSELAIPAAVYAIAMYPCAAIAGWLVTRGRAEPPAPAAPA